MLETEIAALVRFMDPLNLKTYFKEYDIKWICGKRKISPRIAH